MPNPAKTAKKAAYTLHQRDVPPQGFDTLRDLHAALRELPGARDYFQYRWGYRVAPANLFIDVRIHERAGRRRVDLEDPLHPIYNSWPMVDSPFNGDVRPRGTPIAGTGKRTWGNYYRYPRTQRDRRLSQPVFEDDEPRIRGARRPCRIPSAWEDIPRRNWKDRNWKNYRRTQWR